MAFSQIVFLWIIIQVCLKEIPGLERNTYLYLGTEIHHNLWQF